MINKKVVVGMSGGVDSSVSAYILKEQGYEVVGLFMQNWQSEPGEVCTSEIDFKDAAKVCDILDIKLHRANFSDEYWDRVFKEFISEHEKGRTPNPDVLCNREIKFKAFLEYAFKIGADLIATGHYADLVKEDNRTYLKRAIDEDKDQTYFLHEVKENDFEKCLFPLSNLNKSEVRKIAEKLNLPIANKKDSVGICFIGERNLKNFLGKFMSFTKGEILDEKNNLIGKHQGVPLYTIGQRQRLNIGGLKNKEELPWYVYDKDTKKNILYVCQGLNNKKLMQDGLKINNISWINDKAITYPLKCSVQVRHQHKPVQCKLNKEKDMYKVTFSEQIRAITPGQSAVFYKDNICLGGGIIDESF